ncbi:MAG: ribonuclease HII [Alphaproteobacteria bacterium]|nr:ribonuclease HII [Alphaproteobacteria bacterium]
MPDFLIETTISGIVCGIDEAGRGPWAGPVVAGAVVLDRARLDPVLARGLDDSKKLTAPRREVLFAALEAGAASGTVAMATGLASVEEIDRLNILRATFLAMSRAVAALAPCPDHALVDGTGLPDLPCPATAVTKGDQRSLSIAAASIAAKVTRDRLMAALDQDHPGYGFARHAGYGTKAHREALERLGVTPHHRRSFAPIHHILYGR